MKDSKHDVTFKNKQNLENISKFKTCAQSLPIIKFKIFSFIFFDYWDQSPNCPISLFEVTSLLIFCYTINLIIFQFKQHISINTKFSTLVLFQFYVVKDFELNLFLILILFSFKLVGSVLGGFESHRGQNSFFTIYSIREVECEKLFCKTNLKLKSIKIKNISIN